MVQSLNTKAKYTDSATWFRGLPTYGKVLIGDKGFEFYSDKNIKDYIQIPWDEITLVVADVYFKGKYISRFKICTKKSGEFYFATKDTKKTLRQMREYMPSENLRQALSFWQKIKRNIFRK